MRTTKLIRKKLLNLSSHVSLKILGKIPTKSDNSLHWLHIQGIFPLLVLQPAHPANEQHFQDVQCSYHGCTWAALMK